MQRKITIAGQQGFTLIETLVALAIFAIGIVACYTMQVSSTGSSSRANSVSTSANWATSAVEELLAKPYEDDAWFNDDGNDKEDKPGGLADIDDIGPAGTPDGELHIQPDGTTDDTADVNDLYSIYWNVVNVSPMESVKQVRIIVQKNSGLSSGQLYTHDYFKANENL